MTDSPEPRPRSLVSGAMNFRDTGGLRAGAGRTRGGVLFRSGNLTRVDVPGEAALRALGLRRILDLRSDEEVLSSPNIDVGVATTRLPLFLGSVASFFSHDRSLDDMYRSIVDDSADRVVGVVRGVLADQPVLVHCTVGKDRTGVTVALVLAAAGVDEGDVIADYARTERLLPPERTEIVMRKVRDLHPDARYAEDLIARSPAPVMRRLLDDLTTRFGSPSDYLRAHGVSDDEIVALADVLIDRSL